MEYFPPEIIIKYIIARLDYKSFGKFAQVCTTFRLLTHDDLSQKILQEMIKCMFINLRNFLLFISWNHDIFISSVKNSNLKFIFRRIRIFDTRYYETVDMTKRLERRRYKACIGRTFMDTMLWQLLDEYSSFTIHLSPNIYTGNKAFKRVTALCRFLSNCNGVERTNRFITSYLNDKGDIESFRFKIFDMKAFVLSLDRLGNIIG